MAAALQAQLFTLTRIYFRSMTLVHRHVVPIYQLNLSEVIKHSTEVGCNSV